MIFGNTLLISFAYDLKNVSCSILESESDFIPELINVSITLNLFLVICFELSRI